MSESVLIIFLSFSFSIGTAAITWFINRRATAAKAGLDSGEAAESLSNAAARQVETYQKEVIEPLRHRIEELTQQLSVIEEDRYREKLNAQKDVRQLQTQVKELDKQVAFLIGELRRSDSALEYAIGVARVTYPQEMDNALKIRRGQL